MRVAAACIRLVTLVAALAASSGRLAAAEPCHGADPPAPTVVGDVDAHRHAAAPEAADARGDHRHDRPSGPACGECGVGMCSMGGGCGLVVGVGGPTAPRTGPAATGARPCGVARLADRAVAPPTRPPALPEHR